MDDNGQWLSVADAARKLGVTRQAIQGRIKRNTIEHRQDNRGNPIVRMVEPIAAAVPQAIVDNAAAMALPPEPRQKAISTPETVPLSAHRETIDALQRASSEALAAVQTQHRELVEQICADHRLERARDERRHESEMSRVRAEADRVRVEADSKVAAAREEMRGDRAWFALYMTAALLVVALLAPLWHR